MQAPDEVLANKPHNSNMRWTKDSAATFFELMLSRVLLLSVLISVNCVTQPQQGANPYFAPYLEPGELPDGATLPLFHEIWTVMGSGLTSLNFTTQVDLVSTGIFSQYSFQGNATGLDIALAAPTYLDDKLGRLMSIC